MKRLVFESCLLLLYFEFVMHFRGFKQVYDIVREQKSLSGNDGPQPSERRIMPGGRPRLCLLFQDSPLSATFGCNVSAVTPSWMGRGNGDRGAGASLQIACLGRAQRSGCQRQTLHAGYLSSAGPLLM